MQDFGILNIHATKLRVVVKGVWGQIFKNGAISYVLSAIFNHFHDKNPLKKL